MDLVADSDGYIYFNEMLYKMMREMYGEKSLRNKTVIEAELNLMRKLQSI